MDIEHEIAARQQFVLDVIGDLRGRAAGRVAGKAAVEIALVERRGAAAGHRGREVRRRQDDDAALHLARVDEEIQRVHLAWSYAGIPLGGNVPTYASSGLVDTLERLASDIEQEPERVRQSYVVAADRLETIGLVYLWPESN